MEEGLSRSGIERLCQTTPEIAANVTKLLCEMGDIVPVLEAWEASDAKHNIVS